MKIASPFRIQEFTNPSGEIVFRLYARLDGKRFRQNFPTRAEADAERQVQEIQWLQRDTGVRVAATRLTDAQLQEAEAVFRRLEGQPRPLSFYVEFALGNYREPVTRKLLSEAVVAYKAAKEHEREQDLISPMHLARIKREMNRLAKHFPGAAVAEVTGARLRDYLELDGVGHKTYNNRRGHVGTFLRFALERDWIAENPLAKIGARRIRRTRRGAVTLTAEQAAAMMAFVEEHYPAAVPFFALCLFAGIRPCLRSGEILRLRPSHIRLKLARIRIDGEVSKVREPRSIIIQPNLAAWLKAYPLEQFPIIPTNLQHIREKVVEKFGLSHDVMRHTFISMFVAKFRSIGEAALQAGNSEAIIRKHYLDLKTPEEAAQFFGIRPKLAKARASRSKAEANPAVPVLSVAA